MRPWSLALGAFPLLLSGCLGAPNPSWGTEASVALRNPSGPIPGDVAGRMWTESRFMGQPAPNPVADERYVRLEAWDLPPPPIGLHYVAWARDVEDGFHLVGVLEPDEAGHWGTEARLRPDPPWFSVLVHVQSLLDRPQGIVLLASGRGDADYVSGEYQLIHMDLYRSGGGKAVVNSTLEGWSVRAEAYRHGHGFCRGLWHGDCDQDETGLAFCTWIRTEPEAAGFWRPLGCAPTNVRGYSEASGPATTTAVHMLVSLESGLADSPRSPGPLAVARASVCFDVHRVPHACEESH